MCAAAHSWLSPAAARPTAKVKSGLQDDVPGPRATMRSTSRRPVVPHLEVAVQHAGCMHVHHGLGDVGRRLQDGGQVERAACRVAAAEAVRGSTRVSTRTPRRWQRRPRQERRAPSVFVGSALTCQHANHRARL